MEIRLIQITWQSALKNTDFKLMIYKSDYCIGSGQILFFNLLKNTAGLSNTPKLLSHGCKQKTVNRLTNLHVCFQLYFLIYIKSI